ncbi:MAG TPA: TlpA disulfide reductase family protein [Blastocatellia bacterium]|nr:TlpA disulfide reductase family protein [Blastocatellia bacterium]
MSKLSFIGKHHSIRALVLSVIAGLSFAALLAFSGVATAKVKIGELPKDSVAKFPLRMSTGQPISLTDLRGKVAVINFFAVWCGHSRLHVQALTKYGEEENKRGLQIVGLAVDDAETTPQRISEFIHQMKITYPVGLVTDDVFKKYVESKDLSVPQTLVYARDGKLVAHFIGHDDSVAAELDAAIKRELEKR